MRLPLPIMTILLTFCARAVSQNAPGTFDRSFALAPAAPPVPALKYQFICDDAVGPIPGNAAPIYLDAILMMGPDADAKAQKAHDAYDAKKTVVFDTLADSLYHKSFFDELDQAGRREQCDWNLPIEQMGAGTLLPHLAPLRVIGRVIEVRALRLAEQGKIDDAIATLRLGYEMADKIPADRIMISGLVSLAVTRSLNDALVEIMNRPDAPNLYWALSGIPPRRPMLEDSLMGERQFRNSVPNWNRAFYGQDLTADQWQTLFADIKKILETFPQSSSTNPLFPVDPVILAKARQEYAKTRGISASQADLLEPSIMIGFYYMRQFRIAEDDMFKLRTLPYYLLLPRVVEMDDQIRRAHQSEPGNMFLGIIPTLEKAPAAYAETDRELAALTAVEAIRSYSAANQNALPNRLEDIIDIPVPLNPMTGKPFEYNLRADTATLADTQSKDHLKYTITIRR